jgi:predicted kinase
VPAEYGEGLYRPDMRSRVYDELLRQASERLQERQSVILDGTFLTDDFRTRAYDLGYRHGAVPLHVQCMCPRQIAYDRIQQRIDTGRSKSEARTELFDLQEQEYQPPLADEPSMTIDTTQAMSKQLQAVYAELGRRLFD